jgi:hypothetical protein
MLEMAEATLVDVEAVRFLGVCETQGVELRHCPAYIREWIARERKKSPIRRSTPGSKGDPVLSTWRRTRT